MHIILEVSHSRRSDSGARAPRRYYIDVFRRLSDVATLLGGFASSSMLVLTPTHDYPILILILMISSCCAAAERQTHACSLFPLVSISFRLAASLVLERMKAHRI